jgi:transposase, IS30 family
MQEVVVVAVLRGRPGAPRVVRQRFRDLVRSGVSPQEAAAVIGMPRVRDRWLAAAGGVKGNGPGPVGGRYLSLADREEIAVGLARGESCRQVGGRIGRPASTVSREVERNGPRERYRAVRAQALAEQRARRPKEAKLAVSSELREWVRQHLEMKWSPEQISARLAAEFPDRPEMRVSHETICQSIYVQGRGRCAGSWRCACGPGGRCASPAGRAGSGAGRSRAW